MASPEGKKHASRTFERAKKLARACAELAFGTVMLLWPAILARYPLFSWDSAEYIVRVHSEIYGHRSVFYSYFIWATTFDCALSLWFAPIAQAFLTAACVRTLFRVELGNVSTRVFVGVMAFLGIASTIPWHASQIMADFILLPIVLSAHLFVVRWNDLRRLERLLCAGCLALGTTLHGSLAIIVGVAVAIGLARWFLARRPTRELPWRRGAMVAASFALAMAAARIFGGPTTMPTGGSNFYVARLAQTGVLYPTLRDTCATRHFRLCKRLDEVKAIRSSNDFLWATDMIDTMGGWKGAERESSAVSREAMRRYPLRNIMDAAEGTFEQFTRFAPARDWNLIGPDSEANMIMGPVGRVFPGDLPAITRNVWRQKVAFEAMLRLDSLHFFLGWFGLAVLGVATFRARGTMRSFARTALAFCVANAAVCGALSAPFERYQSRVIGVEAIFLAWLALHLIRRHRLM